MTNFIYKKTLIIGLGLIGGSIAKSFKKNNISEKIWAYDLDSEAIELAKMEKIIEDIFLLENTLHEFDIIALCAPLNQYQKIFSKISQNLSANTIIFDIGSIKNFKFKNLPNNFIPCHPIAGSQLSGYENSNEDLFLHKKFIICAPQNVNSQKIFDLAQMIGSKPEYLQAEEHDKIFALTSHLPQFLSFLCSDFSLKKIENKFLEKAFRLDKSNPEIWRDIFDLNQNNLEFFYEKFLDNLENYINNIENIKPKKVFDNLENSQYIDNNLIFDKNFKDYFEKNFSVIFFRFLVALSLLEIPEIKYYKNYTGEGFKDFVSIINIANLDEAFLNFLIKNNHRKIVDYFENITN